jgi:hypothetical protein
MMASTIKIVYSMYVEYPFRGQLKTFVPALRRWSVES